MIWNEYTQMLLEMNVFRGKIIERRKGRGGLVYIVELDTYPNRVAYKTVQEFESNLSVNTEGIDREARNWFHFADHPLESWSGKTGQVHKWANWSIDNQGGSVNE